MCPALTSMRDEYIEFVYFFNITGVIYLKNLVCQFWEEKEPGQTTDAVPFCIHEQDKAALRDNMVEAVISTADPIRYIYTTVEKQLNP